MIDFSFRRPILYCIAFLVLCGAGIILKAARPSDAAQVRYDEIEASQPRKARKSRLKEKHELTKQVRWDVQKTLWMSEGAVRRILELHAKRSEVAMFAKRNNLHFVETFYNASGIVQQELYYKDASGKEYIMAKEGTLRLRDKEALLPTPFDRTKLIPMQCFRYFEANKALYDFDEESLIAEDVKFWTYIAQGHGLHTMPTKLVPVAIGTASTMTLPKKNEEREFYAENLRLQIHNERGVW